MRVIVLTGAGDKAFAAGADIKYMSALSVEAGEGVGRRSATRSAGSSRRRRSRRSRRSTASPSAAAASSRSRATSATRPRRAKLGQPEVNLGIFPGWGGTQRLARVCGLGVAKDLILTGRVVDADEALRIGLVNGVFEPAELLEKTLEVARTIASKGPLALSAAKAAINHALQGDHVENLEAEADGFGELFSSDGRPEGMTAFVEKREPRLHR